MRPPKRRSQISRHEGDAGPSALYTNQFAGKVKLTQEEWSNVRASVKDYTL